MCETPGATAGDNHSTQEQWIKEDIKGVEVERGWQKVVHDPGVQIRERKKDIFGKESIKESQEGEDELVNQNGRDCWPLSCMDEGMKAELQDCFDSWVLSCDAAEVAMDQKSLAEEELKQCFERHRTSWEPTARKAEVAAEMAWQDWDRLKNLTEERGWVKEKAGMSICTEWRREKTRRSGEAKTKQDAIGERDE